MTHAHGIKELIIPDYGSAERPGHTIANLPATVARLMQRPFAGLPALPETHWEPLLAKGEIERVVILILDAMGRTFWEPSLAAVQNGVRGRLLGRATVAEEITSVFPSTTVNCLSSIWTGHPPGQHGLVAINLHSPRTNSVNNMLRLSPMIAYGYNDIMVKAGIDPEQFLPVPGIAEQFKAAEVPTTDIKGKEIVNSALSRMLGRGVTRSRGVVSYADLMWQIKTSLEEDAGPQLIVGYWPSLDTLSHIYGPSHPLVGRELDSILTQLEATLLDDLSPAARQKTALLLVADHGQMTLNHQQSIRPAEHPLLLDNLMLTQVGEGRVPYLYIRASEYQAVLDYMRTEMSELGIVLTRAELYERGWLGPGPYMQELDGRLGDLIFLLRDEACWLPPHERMLSHFVGMHGGLTPDEMRVQMLGFRLDEN